MKKLLLVMSVAGIVALTGCSSLLSTVNQNEPHTTFKIALGNASVTYQSPKDVVATNVVFTVNTNGTTSLVIGSISATQDTNELSETAQALTAQANGSVNQINAVFTGLQGVGVTAVKTAAK